MEAAATTSMVFLAVAARHCDHGAQTKMGLQPLLVTILVLRAETVAFCSFCSPSASRRAYRGSSRAAIQSLRSGDPLIHAGRDRSETKSNLRPGTLPSISEGACRGTAGPSTQCSCCVCVFAFRQQLRANSYRPISIQLSKI